MYLLPILFLCQEGPMATQDQGFKIRWGKVSLALLGALALLAVPVTFVLACFTTLSFLVPLGCAVLVAASFVGLRTAAIRDRKRKAWARAESAVPEAEFAEKARQEPEDGSDQIIAAEVPENVADASRSAAAAESVSAYVAEPEAEITEEAFDFEAPFTEVETPSKPGVTSELDDANGEAEVGAAEVDGSAQGRQAAVEQAEESTTAAQMSSNSTWSPRDIPTPTYVGAEPVERDLPSAEPAAEEKKATSVTSIRKAERDRAEQERSGSEVRDIEPSAQADLSVQAHVSAGGADDEFVNAESAKRLDLDAVLQRRRA